jgi:hypothetical protein
MKLIYESKSIHGSGKSHWRFLVKTQNVAGFFISVSENLPAFIFNEIIQLQDQSSLKHLTKEGISSYQYLLMYVRIYSYDY